MYITFGDVLRLLSEVDVPHPPQHALEGEWFVLNKDIPEALVKAARRGKTVLPILLMGVGPLEGLPLAGRLVVVRKHYTELKCGEECCYHGYADHQVVARFKEHLTKLGLRVESPRPDLLLARWD